MIVQSLMKYLKMTALYTYKDQSGVLVVLFPQAGKNSNIPMTQVKLTLPNIKIIFDITNQIPQISDHVSEVFHLAHRITGFRSRICLKLEAAAEELCK